MMSLALLRDIGDIVLPISFVGILLAGIYLTFVTRFIQVRMVPRMIKMLWQSFAGQNEQSSSNALPAHKALFAAMSTTIGIGNIVGPAVAVRLGGPGALVGFLMATFFGAAMTYAEVTFALHFRKKNADGSFSGGPMYFLRESLGLLTARIYAVAGALLLAVWCSNQSNTLADILCSYSIPKATTGFVIAVLVVTYLILGVKHIGNLAEKLVPTMFFLYCFAALWIIGMNVAQLPAIIKLVLQSAFSIKAFSGAAVGVMLRWGLAKGTQACEAGIGTATIMHAQSENTSAVSQGILSMVSVYSVAFVCTLSALVTLLTGTWNNQSVSLGIAMIAQPFEIYFFAGKIVLAVSAFLFGFGTILGNAYNGSRCFDYLTRGSVIALYGYYAIVALVVFFGAILDVELVWTISDFFIIPVALPNIAGILYLAIKRPELLRTK